MPRPNGHIDHAVDSLLWAVADLEEIRIRDADEHIDAAIARVHEASSTVLANYVAMLETLKTDVVAIRRRILDAAMSIEDLAVRIDHGEN
jgi:hypothetical protein